MNRQIKIQLSDLKFKVSLKIRVASALKRFVSLEGFGDFLHTGELKCRRIKKVKLLLKSEKFALLFCF